MTTQIGFKTRLEYIAADIELAHNFSIQIGQDKEVLGGRFYYQIAFWRQDVITGEWGTGYGGKAYLSPHASDSELIQTIFSLYKGYWEHEARETFKWKGRRIFGPHISAAALWQVARQVDLRQEKEDQGNE